MFDFLTTEVLHSIDKTNLNLQPFLLSSKAIPRCFVSHRPVPCDGGSVSREKQKQKQKKTKKTEKKEKKRKENEERTLEGVWVPEKTGLLSKKAWLQSQLENVVFSTFCSLGSRQVQMLDSAIHRTNHYPADKY